MKRYIVSRIIGTGTEDDPYRPKIADQGIPFTASIPCDPVTGKPTKTHAFCIAASRDFQTILRDADNDGLPDVALDIKVSAIKRATVDAMLAALGKLGIDLGAATSADGYRDVINAVGRQLDGLHFDANAFDITDVV